MILVVLIAASLLLGTIIVHGIAVIVLYGFSVKPFAKAAGLSNAMRLGYTYVFVLGFVVAHFIEIMIWALAYWLTGALENMEEAVYFSAVTFATIGYGDVTLTGHWRIASALEGVNGILLFGWTTAFLFKLSGMLWFPEGSAPEVSDRE